MTGSSLIEYTTPEIPEIREAQSGYSARRTVPKQFPWSRVNTSRNNNLWTGSETEIVEIPVFAKLEKKKKKLEVFVSSAVSQRNF